MEELNSIISQVFGIKQDEIKDDYGPNNIPRWDSLSQLALVSAIEIHYKVTLEIEEIFQIMTIGDIRTVLEKKLKENKES